IGALIHIASVGVMPLAVALRVSADVGAVRILPEKRTVRALPYICAVRVPPDARTVREFLIPVVVLPGAGLVIRSGKLTLAAHFSYSRQEALLPRTRQVEDIVVGARAVQVLDDAGQLADVAFA